MCPAHHCRSIGDP
jgi:hypothetical protein